MNCDGVRVAGGYNERMYEVGWRESLCVFAELWP